MRSTSFSNEKEAEKEEQRRKDKEKHRLEMCLKRQEKIDTELRRLRLDMNKLMKALKELTEAVMIKDHVQMIEEEIFEVKEIIKQLTEEIQECQKKLSIKGENLISTQNLEPRLTSHSWVTTCPSQRQRWRAVGRALGPGKPGAARKAASRRSHKTQTADLQKQENSRENPTASWELRFQNVESEVSQLKVLVQEVSNKLSQEGTGGASQNLRGSNDEPGDASIQNLRGMNQWRTCFLNYRGCPGCPCITDFLRTLEHHTCFLSQDSVAADSGSQCSHGCGPTVGFRPFKTQTGSPLELHQNTSPPNLPSSGPAPQWASAAAAAASRGPPATWDDSSSDQPDFLGGTSTSRLLERADSMLETVLPLYQAMNLSI